MTTNATRKQSYAYTIITKHWHFCNNRYLLQDAKCCLRQVGDRASPVRLFICGQWFMERVLLRKITRASSFFTFCRSHNDLSMWTLRINIGPQWCDMEPAYPSSYRVNTKGTCNPMKHGPSWETPSPLAVQILQKWLTVFTSLQNPATANLSCTRRYHHNVLTL